MRAEALGSSRLEGVDVKKQQQHEQKGFLRCGKAGTATTDTTFTSSTLCSVASATVAADLGLLCNVTLF